MTPHQCTATSINSGERCKLLATVGDKCKYHNPEAYLNIKPEPIIVNGKLNTNEDLLELQTEMILKLSAKPNPSSKDFAAFASLSNSWQKTKQQLAKDSALMSAIEKLNKLKK